MIVGTAGHVDHGKTALVRALTGVDADRLAEEKARGISIDLGFAYLPLGDDEGTVIGFVDVPGHERFMRNMLAGASGIDAALLVVAADDGIMPQTREHLAVIDLLGVAGGLVAVTKADLVSPARIAALREELAALLAGTVLAGAPVFAVSSTSGAGLDGLRAGLAAAARAGPAARGARAFRMPVDRSFSLAGAGTVVTGTVIGGEIAAGDALVLSPSGRPVRVRGLHAQNRQAPSAGTGTRCGINLAGVARTEVSRGQVLLAPALHAPSARIDAVVRVLAGEPRALGHWMPVRVHHGAAEVHGRVALLEDAPIAPGDEGRVQLVLDQPIAAAVGDRFVLRDTAGTRTVGGGRLVDLRAPSRRRRTPARLAELAAMDRVDPAEALAALLAVSPRGVALSAFRRDRALACGTVLAVPHVAVAGREGSVLFAPNEWQRIAAQAGEALAAFHARFPQLLGLGSERLAAALSPRLPRGLAAAVAQELARQGIVAGSGGVWRLPGHVLGLDRGDSAIWAALAPLLGGEARFQPPRLGALAAAAGLREFDARRVLKAKAQQGEVVEIAGQMFLLRATLVEIAGIVGEIAAAAPEGRFIAANLRDRLGGGRKAAIEVLEHFDRLGVTLRHGDERTIDSVRLARFVTG